MNEKLTEEQKSLLLRWVEALESGKYKQTTVSFLKYKDDGFCCLGVLCDLENPNWIGYNTSIEDKITAYRWVDSNNEQHGVTYPPNFVLFKYGLIDNIDSINGERYSKYAKMNDTGKSFLEIAKEIRKDFQLD